ncbi:hypothetical protein LCGC14_2141600, partial [marine sediment metagenome]
ADVTKVLAINLANPISQFQIVYESTSVGSTITKGHAAKCISRIELVDGSNVLFSLTGQECQALDFYHSKKEPANLNVYLNGMNCEQVFNVNFGRFLWDPMFAFDPTKFVNPQLKITIDIDGGGSAPVAGFITVFANIFDEKEISPVGFLSASEVVDYSMASASHEYVDLPTDFPFRKLLIRAQTEGAGLEYLIDTVKISEDNDRKIPLNLTMFEILRNISGWQRPFIEDLVIPAGAPSNNFYCTPAYWPTLGVAPWQGSAETHVGTVYGGDGGKGTLYVESTGGNWTIHVQGYAPHGVIDIPFGLQNDQTDWYDFAKIGSLRLDIKSISGRSSSDKVQVFLQQLRNYA